MTKSEKVYVDYHREMRCSTCIEMQVECPKGYYSEVVKCDMCAYRYARCWAACGEEPKCPRCNGSVETDPRYGT